MFPERFCGRYCSRYGSTGSDCSDPVAHCPEWEPVAHIFSIKSRVSVLNTGCAASSSLLFIILMDRMSRHSGGWESVASAVMQILVKREATPEGKALHLPLNLRSPLLYVYGGYEQPGAGYLGWLSETGRGQVQGQAAADQARPTGRRPWGRPGPGHPAGITSLSVPRTPPGARRC